METLNKLAQGLEATGHDRCPTLRALGLGDPELEQLRKQGYLERDWRGSGRSGHCRLRFRDGERLRTIYLGHDAELVDNVRVEISRLRAARQRGREAAQAAQRAGRRLREVKRQLAPMLATLGLHYHGDQLRKYRK